MLKSNKTLRAFVSIMGGLMLLFSLFLPARAASALGATSSTLPVFFLRSADCTGEIVQISGTMHLVSVTQPDGSIVSHFNYQNVTGLGLTSGTTYKVTAVDHVRLSAPFPSSIQSAQSFLLISQGAGSNLLVQALFHITVDANGQVTASIDELSVQCT